MKNMGLCLYMFLYLYSLHVSLSVALPVFVFNSLSLFPCHTFLVSLSLSLSVYFLVSFSLKQRWSLSHICQLDISYSLCSPFFAFSNKVLCQNSSVNLIDFLICAKNKYNFRAAISH